MNRTGLCIDLRFCGVDGVGPEGEDESEHERGADGDAQPRALVVLQHEVRQHHDHDGLRVDDGVHRGDGGDLQRHEDDDEAHAADHSHEEERRVRGEAVAPRSVLEAFRTKRCAAKQTEAQEKHDLKCKNQES